MFGYARVSVAVDADVNNLENQRRVLADCEQVFEDVGSGASWNRPGLGGRDAAGRSRAAWGIMGNGCGLRVPKM